MRVYLAKKGVEVNFGELDLSELSPTLPTAVIIEMIHERMNGLIQDNHGRLERILGRVEGMLLALGCDRQKVKELNEWIKRQIMDMLGNKSDFFLMAKMVELLEDGWTYCVEAEGRQK